MWRKAFNYLFVGAFVYLIGCIFAVPAQNFLDTAEPAQLIVLRVDEKYDHEDGYRYRPVFALAAEEGQGPEYAGAIWVSPKPHQPGDIVAGGYVAETGEMRSDKMARDTLWIGRLAQAFGLLFLLQGILMFFGFPEVLPVRFGSRRRRYRWR